MIGDKIIMAPCKHCPLSKFPKNVICGICKILRHPNLYQYLKSLNYFAIFSIDPKYRVDTEKLSSMYKEIQKSIHPDVCKIKDADSCSSLVSQAYQTLKNDLTRAEYLLNLYKVETNNNRANGYEKLEKLYSIQEQIENEKESEKVIKVKKEIEGEIAQCKKEIAIGFSKKNYSYIKDLLTDIKYNQAIINSINKKLNLI